MAFLPAGVIDGALTYAELIRRIAYSGSDGVSAVLTPADLAVSALASPGAAVNIAPGTGLIVSTYAGAAGQAYVVANDATLQQSVPANGTGSTVTQRVLVSVRDPQYPGMPTPANPATDTYLDVEVRLTFPSDRPYLHLADIVMPAGASTVTAGMIVPRTVVGTPRTFTDAAPYFPAAVKNMPTSVYGDWPGLGIQVPVPSWATYCLAEFMVNGINYTGTDTGTGGVRVSLAGTSDTQNGIIRINGNQQRPPMFVIGRWNIPASVRGTTQPLVLEGLRSGGTGNFTVDNQSQVLAKWTFSERV